MSLPCYPKCKDSGLPWLGDVPEHWKIQPLLGIALERNESNHGMLEDNLLSLSYGRIVQKDIDSNDGLLPESFETYQIIHPGDIVFRLTDLQNDKRSLRTAIVEERGIITSAYLAVVPRKLQASFLSHLLRAYDVTKVFYSMGGGLRQSMKFADVKRLPILCPPPEEQVAITAFLERETGKIDALVEVQRRLIELLKEKRQAIIFRVVTKGLNRDAPMKDSGVQWLGDVPAHWKVLAAKRVSTIFVPQRNKPDLNVVEDGTFWVTMEQMKDERIERSEWWVSPASAEAAGTRVLSSGAVIASCVGNFGAASINTVDVVINQQLQAFIPTDEVHPEFLRLSVVQAKSYFERIGTAATLVYVNQQGFGNMPLALPSLSEQTQIVDSIVELSGQIDDLIWEATRAVDLLRERRTALISAAITGKIDVRGLVAEDAA